MANRLLRLALPLLLTCPSAWAQSPVGSEFVVNAYTTSDQRAPALAPTGSGNFVVVWQSFGQDGDAFGISGQRFNPSGVPQGSEFQVNSTATSEQDSAVVAGDPSGSFVVVWRSRDQDGSYGGIFGQRFDAAGIPQGTEFQINSYTTNYQSRPGVAADASGNFVVVWQGNYQDGSAYGIFGQRFSASGVPVGGEFQVNSNATADQFRPAIASGTSGNFVVVWQSEGQDGSYAGIFGRRFSATGVPQGSEFQVNSYTTGLQTYPSVAIDAAGNFVVVWASYGQPGDSAYGVFGQRFNASGVPQGSEFQVNSYTTNSQSLPSVAQDPSGDFVVVWRSFGPDGSGYGVFGRPFDASGNPYRSEFRVNSYTTGYQLDPAVTATSSGRFVVSWQSLAQDGYGYGIFGRRVLTDSIFADGFQ